MMFRTRPYALRFYRTESRSFPSAWAQDGVVGLQRRGPLHQDGADIGAVLFHELFPPQRSGARALVGARARRRLRGHPSRCGNDERCLEPFAPDDVRVDGGTYYALDETTNDVREYAADLALRWLREHRALLRGDPLEDALFRCKTPENAEAWRLVVDEFFGAST